MGQDEPPQNGGPPVPGAARLPEEVPSFPPPPVQAPPLSAPAPTSAAPTSVAPAAEEAPAQAVAPAAEEKPAATTPEGEEMVYLNVQDQDIREVIKQISKATSRNFIIDDKVRGKVTIISEKMVTKAEAYQMFLSALQVAGFTTVQGPAGVIKIVALRDASRFPIPTHVDTLPYTDSFVTRLIRLENISANDMSNAIKNLISKDGDLFAYPETNTLVITDSGTNIDRLMKIIKELDQEGPQEIVDIIALHFANAKDVASIVTSIFEEQQKQAAGRPARGGPEAGGESAEVSKIIADERSNSIIVMASKRAIDKVRDLINRLDARLEEGAEGKIHVYYLRYAKAKDIAGVLQSLSGVAKAPAGAGGAKNEGVIVAELEDFKVAADEQTNSLLITSNAKTYNTLVDRVISKLDIPRKQVYLEAIIMEFFLSKSTQLGVTAHGGGGIAGMLPFGQTFQSLGQLFSPTSGLFNQPGLLGGVLSRQNVDIQLPDNTGALKTFSVPAFSAFLTALKSFGDTNIVSTPSILTLDNEEASIEITSQEPRPGTQTITNTNAVQIAPVEYEEAGLKLKITPQISGEGGGNSVRLQIENELSTFSAPEHPELKALAKKKRVVKTSVVTDDGETVVLGGLMEDKEDIKKSKVPLLGDIPILGFLFRHTDESNKKSNLLIFITPYVVRDSGDFNKILQKKIAQRNDFIDQSYSKKRQSNLRAIIKSHRADLLDLAAPASKSVRPQSFAPPPGQVGPAPAVPTEGYVRPPVVTVPPPGSKTAPSDLDLAY